MTQAPSTIKLDLLAAYAAAGAKVGSWAVVSAVAFRSGGADVLSVLALVRGTIGFLNYMTLGVAPALIHFASGLGSPKRVITISSDDAAVELADAPRVLSYAERKTDEPHSPDPTYVAYYHASLIGIAFALIGFGCLYWYSESIRYLHRLPVYLDWWEIGRFALFLGVGFLFRLLSDIPGGVLQTKRLLSVDQTLVAVCEICWAAWITKEALYRQYRGSDLLVQIGGYYAITGFLLLAVKVLVVACLRDRRTRAVSFHLLDDFSRPLFQSLLSYGSLLMVAQLADFLYAPTDMILINRLIDPATVAIYAPAIQIDAALLLLVGGLASVILPRAALAHAAGDVGQLRRDYVRGTLVSFGLLVGGAIFLLLISPWLFKAWFNDPLVATQAILPWVLVHTVVGGSSAVGRSILLGTGRVKAYTAAALVAGGMNVVLSYSFVKFFGMGLNGIVLGTIVVVVARCGVWMPWYVWRVLREPASDQRGSSIVPG